MEKEQYHCELMAKRLNSALAKMGSSSTRPTMGYGKELYNPSNICVVCDECGRVFTVAAQVVNGTDKKKRCDRPVNSIIKALICS